MFTPAAPRARQSTLDRAECEKQSTVHTRTESERSLVYKAARVQRDEKGGGFSALRCVCDIAAKYAFTLMRNKINWHNGPYRYSRDGERLGTLKYMANVSNMSNSHRGRATRACQTRIANQLPPREIKRRGSPEYPQRRR